MYGSLLQHWNMLAVDNRGTGKSTPLSCPALQNFSGPTASEAFEQTAGTCAAALNHRWRYPDRSWVHASDMFTSAPAAEDLADVIEALQLGKVDLYGDSYGSFFAQVFASRFPKLLRSVILDSTYETSGLDPWYRSSAAAMPGNFNTVCSRSPACAAAAPGSSWTRITTLAERLRGSPISGVVPGPGGKLEKVHMEVVGEGDTACGSELIQRFVTDPAAIDSLDASCAPTVPPIHAVGIYPSKLAEEPPLAPSPGSAASAQALALAAAAVETAGDAVERHWTTELRLDRGLEGGTVTASAGGTLLTLKRDQLIVGVAVSGTVRLTPASPAGDGQSVLATLTTSASGLKGGSFTASWSTAGVGSAQVLGTVGSESVSGSMSSP